MLDPIAESLQSAQPIALTVTPRPVADLLGELPESVGDALPGGAHRDRLDQRVLDDLANCSGKVINRPSDIDGWTDIAAASALPDSDGDLLPDEWEASRPALDPGRADDPWQDGDGDGLSEIETWLAELAGDI